MSQDALAEIEQRLSPELAMMRAERERLATFGRDRRRGSEELMTPSGGSQLLGTKARAQQRDLLLDGLSANGVGPRQNFRGGIVVQGDGRDPIVEGADRVQFGRSAPLQSAAYDVVGQTKYLLSVSMAGQTGLWLGTAPPTAEGPTLGTFTNPTYCVIGDQSMVDKWIAQSTLLRQIGFWFGVPYQIALFTPGMYQFSADGGGTWKSWHKYACTTHLGSYGSAVAGACTCCVGSTRYRVQAQRRDSSEPLTLVDMEIPEGHTAAFTAAFWEEYPPFQGIIQSALPGFAPTPASLLGGTPQRFAPMEFLIDAEGGQHRYHVHFRRPSEIYDVFTDTRTPQQALEDGLIGSAYDALEPTLPPDP